MFSKKNGTNVTRVVRNAGEISGQGLSSLRRDIFIIVYPVMVFLVVLVTVPTINALILAAFNGAAHHSIFSFDEQATKSVFYYIAVLVTALYTALIISFFTCLISAAVLAELDGQPTPFLQGLKLIYKNKGKISRFGIFSIPFVFIPVGVMAQKHKIFKSTAAVVGSSYSLSMAQLAPAILSEDEEDLFETVRHTIATLGQAWREGLVLKIGSYLLILILAGVSLLPKALSHSQNNGGARLASWLVPIVVFLGFLIVTKVLSAVFTATLYWRVITNDGKKGKLLD
ncbi:MAG TPA: hypothetical protein VFT49_04245 [Candidatus Saccharimonadales bacterium]|nr:hypothetical protein [Candidatus Saccharimonadales bacterium]